MTLCDSFGFLSNLSVTLETVYIYLHLLLYVLEMFIMADEKAWCLTGITWY